MTWYRFWKIAGPAGSHHEEYLWMDSGQTGPEDVDAECERWAQNMPGGHNTHYRYGFEQVDRPPQETLERMAEAAQCSSVRSAQEADFLRALIENSAFDPR